MRWSAYVAEQYAKHTGRIKRDLPLRLLYPMPASIEWQLDVMIHRTQITERYPFTVVRSK